MNGAPVNRTSLLIAVLTVSCAISAGRGWSAPSGKPGKTPPPAAPPGAATVLSLPPGAGVNRSGKPVKGVRKGAVLKPADILRLPRGNLDGRLANLGAFRLKGPAELVITALAQGAEGFRFTLRRGTLLLRLWRLTGKSRFVVDTPAAITAARGTGFLVEASAARTAVLVDEGAVSVRLREGGDRELVVAAREKTVVAGGQLPESAQPLTAADERRVREVRQLAMPAITSWGGIVWASGPAGSRMGNLRWIDARDMALHSPQGIAVAPDGTVYVSDERARSIWMLRGGRAAVLFGTGKYEPPPAGSPLAGPRRLALGLAGELLVADGYRVMAIDSAGKATVVAGVNERGDVEADRTRTRFDGVRDLAVGVDGAIYLLTNRIQRVRPEGVQTLLDKQGRPVGGNSVCICRIDERTLAVGGSSQVITVDTLTGEAQALTRAGEGWRDGNRDQTRLWNILALAYANGAVYCDNGDFNVIRRIGLDGTASTPAGSGIAGRADGMGAQAQLDRITSLASGPGGDIYLVEQNVGRVRVVGRDGGVRSLSGQRTGHDITDRSPGYRDGPFSEARVSMLKKIFMSPAGQLYLFDLNRLRRVTSDGRIETLAGKGTNGSDDGPGSQATFDAYPNSAFFMPDGSLMAWYGYGGLRRIDPDGTVRTIFRPSPDEFPGVGGSCCADPTGRYYFASRSALYAFREGEKPALFASEPNDEPRRAPRDGDGRAARFGDPGALFYGAGGIYVLDISPVAPPPTGSYSVAPVIRRVDAMGRVRAIAGSGRLGTEDGRGVAAAFSTIEGVCVDRSGILYLMDGQPQGPTLRRVTPDGDVRTLARIPPDYPYRGYASGSLATLDGETFYLGGVYTGWLHRWHPPDRPEMLIGRPAPYPPGP